MSRHIDHKNVCFGVSSRSLPSFISKFAGGAVRRRCFASDFGNPMWPFFFRRLFFSMTRTAWRYHPCPAKIYMRCASPSNLLSDVDFARWPLSYCSMLCAHPPSDPIKNGARWPNGEPQNIDFWTAHINSDITEREWMPKLYRNRFVSEIHTH